jgi:hypothetical protein
MPARNNQSHCSSKALREEGAGEHQLAMPRFSFPFRSHGAGKKIVIERAVITPQIEIIVHPINAGRLASACHWHPVPKMYVIPLITSRRSIVRSLPTGFAGGVNGVINADASAVMALAVLRRPHHAPE